MSALCTQADYCSAAKVLCLITSLEVLAQSIEAVGDARQSRALRARRSGGRVNVRYGSMDDIVSGLRRVRFSPDSGHHSHRLARVRSGALQQAAASRCRVRRGDGCLLHRERQHRAGVAYATSRPRRGRLKNPLSDVVFLAGGLCW